MKQFSLIDGPAPFPMRRGANLSPCGKFRFSLLRRWGAPEDNDYVCWIMLNPSTADDSQEDPTLNRCIAFTKSWGYNNLLVVNLYPYRSPDPKKCQAWADFENNGPDWHARDVIYHENLPLVVRVANNAKMVVAACGMRKRNWKPGVEVGFVLWRAENDRNTCMHIATVDHRDDFLSVYDDGGI